MNCHRRLKCDFDHVWQIAFEATPLLKKKAGDIKLTLHIYKACGLDIHKKFMIATILCRDGDKEQMRFDRDDEGILSLRSWVVENECNVVACKSTSDFWVPIYDTLINYVPVIVGNARDMKAFNHKKTDKIDSEFIAQLALNNII